MLGGMDDQGFDTDRALFPGSFDPPTLGHVDLIERALCRFSRVTGAVGENSTKRPLFSVTERMALLEESLGEREGLSVTSYDGLLSDYCRETGHGLVIRGVRNASDFDFEASLARMNASLLPGLETLFLPAAPRFSSLSSTLAKEIVAAGGDASPFLPACVIRALRGKLGL